MSELPEYLKPNEVAEVLRISVDQVYRIFPGRRGVLNIGSPERLHRRKYSVLRISRGALAEFIEEHSKG